MEKGSFKSKSDNVTEKDKLKIAIAKLQRQIKTLETEIITIKQSETFKTIISITDWNIYFSSTKDKLENELVELRKEIEV